MKKVITISLITIALFITACDAAKDKFEPKSVIKEYVEALQAKDVTKLKATASAKTVKLFEDAAKAQNISLEEMIKKNEPQIQPMLQNPELRNEKVEGDKATVEIKNPTDEQWSNLVFVKEDGRWKVGAGEMFEDVKKKIDEEAAKQKENTEAADEGKDSDKKEDSNKAPESEKKEDK